MILLKSFNFGKRVLAVLLLKVNFLIDPRTSKELTGSEPGSEPGYHVYEPIVSVIFKKY